MDAHAKALRQLSTVRLVTPLRQYKYYVVYHKWNRNHRTAGRILKYQKIEHRSENEKVGNKCKIYFLPKQSNTRAQDIRSV